MSPRESAQNELVEFLEKHGSRFNAPYGVLTGMHTVGKTKGKIRTVTFGVARYLDATAEIWSTSHVVVSSDGKLGHKVNGVFVGVPAFIEFLKKEWCLS